MQIKEDSLWKKKYFACQKEPKAEEHVNKEIIDLLEILRQNSETRGDKWRAYAYRRAVSILKNTKVKIKTEEQARKLNGIGKRIAAKVFFFFFFFLFFVCLGVWEFLYLLFLFIIVVIYLFIFLLLFRLVKSWLLGSLEGWNWKRMMRKPLS